jgi:hypothetical protein
VISDRQRLTNNGEYNENNSDPVNTGCPIHNLDGMPWARFSHDLW